MNLKLGEIADIVKGNLIGDPEIEIAGVAPMNKARQGEITFLFKKKDVNQLSDSSPSAVILGEDLKLDIPRIVVTEPHNALSLLLEVFHPPQKPKNGIDKTARLGSNIKVGDGVSIFPFVYIDDDATVGNCVTLYPGVYLGEGTTVGDNTTIYSNVSIQKNIVIGKNVIIHSNSVIGSDGFGFFLSSDGKYKKIPQVGGVIIEDNVEIGANVCIDRGTLDDTVIKKGTKIDNLVQIAHNVTVGEDTVIAGQSGISGSSVIGRGVRMGGKVGVADHVVIDDGTMLAANTGVAGNLQKGIYSGSPAIEHSKWKRIQVSLLRLPDLLKRVKAQEKRVKELEDKAK